MKIKVCNATPLQLDWLVAKCEGHTPNVQTDFVTLTPIKHPADWRTAEEYSPSTNWAQGGSILSAAHISRTINHSGLWIAYWTDGYTDGDEGLLHMHCDRSELVAGLRCYVAMKLGDEVEIPEELL